MCCILSITAQKRRLGDGSAAHQTYERTSPSSASIDTYTGRPPELIPVDITDGTVMEVAGRLSEGARLGGSESMSLKHCVLILGAAIGEFQLTVTEFSEWLANRGTPWDSYRAVMSGRLIALDKQPGVWPVRVVETWRQLMAKCVLRLTGDEAKAA